MPPPLSIGLGLPDYRETAGAFVPSSLPGLIIQIPMMEGAGNGAANVAAAVPTTSFPNLVGSPEQMFNMQVTQGGWEDIFGGATRTDNFAANPNNAETTATRLQFTAGVSKGIRYRPNGVNFASVGQTFTISCYVKSNSGATETVRLLYGDTPTFSTDQAVTVAAGWVRVSFTFVTPATCSYVGIGGGSAGGVADVLIWGFTLHAGAVDLGYTNAQGDMLFPNWGISPTWSAGRGITFPGVNQWVMMPLGKSQTLNGVSIYVVCRRAATVTDNQRWYGALLSTAGVTFTLQPVGLCVGGMIAQSQYRGGPTLSYGSTAVAGTINASATEGVLTGTDHCICATHDGTTLRILIDGHLLAESTAFPKAAQAVSCLLSGFVQGGAGYLKGDLLYMAVYNQGHTVAQARTGIAGLLALCAARTGFVAPPTNKVVIYEGDSLTLEAGVDPAFPWTRNCTEAALAPLGIQARCFAVTGSHIGPYPESPGDTNTIRNRIATDLATMQISGVTKTIVAWLGGTNDATDTTVATAIANQHALGDTIRAAGAVAIPMTMPPKQNLATPNAFRAALNTDNKDAANIGVHYNGIIDTTGDAILGPDATAVDPTYYQADAIHWKQAGTDRCEPYASAAVTAQL